MKYLPQHPIAQVESFDGFLRLMRLSIQLSVTATLVAPTTEASPLRMADKIDLPVLKAHTRDADVDAVAEEVATLTDTAGVLEGKILDML